MSVVPPTTILLDKRVIVTRPVGQPLVLQSDGHVPVVSPISQVPLLQAGKAHSYRDQQAASLQSMKPLPLSSIPL